MSDGNYVEYTLQRIEYEDHDRVRENVHMFRSEDDLVEVLENTAYFLQGCSFTYVKGLTAEKEST